MGGLLRTSKASSVTDYINKIYSTMNIYTTNMGEDELDFNMVDIYIDQLFNDCIRITFTEEEKARFNKNPKRLSHELWKTTDLFYVIMSMNNLADFSDMDLTTIEYIYIPSGSMIQFLINLTRKSLNGNLPILSPTN